MNFDTFLAQNSAAFVPMFDPPLTESNCVSMDLSSSSREFSGLQAQELDQAILHKLEAAAAIAANLQKAHSLPQEPVGHWFQPYAEENFKPNL